MRSIEEVARGGAGQRQTPSLDTERQPSERPLEEAAGAGAGQRPLTASIITDVPMAAASLRGRARWGHQALRGPSSREKRLRDVLGWRTEVDRVWDEFLPLMEELPARAESAPSRAQADKERMSHLAELLGRREALEVMPSRGHYWQESVLTYPYPQASLRPAFEARHAHFKPWVHKDLALVDSLTNNRLARKRSNWRLTRPAQIAREKLAVASEQLCIREHVTRVETALRDREASWAAHTHGDPMVLQSEIHLLQEAQRAWAQELTDCGHRLDELGKPPAVNCLNGTLTVAGKLGVIKESFLESREGKRVLYGAAIGGPITGVLGASAGWTAFAITQHKNAKPPVAQPVTVQGPVNVQGSMSGSLTAPNGQPLGNINANIGPPKRRR